MFRIWVEDVQEYLDALDDLDKPSTNAVVDL